MVLGYIFTVLNYLLYCVSRFCKKKYQMLALDLLAKIAFIIGLFFMGSFSGVFSMMVNFCYLIAANIRERTHRKWTWLYLIFQAALVFIMIQNFAGISSLLIFISTSIALLSVWWLPPQQMRLAGSIGNIITLLYQLSIQNWAGLCELLVITSNITSYLKYRKNADNVPQKVS